MSFDIDEDGVNKNLCRLRRKQTGCAVSEFRWE